MSDVCTSSTTGDVCLYKNITRRAGAGCRDGTSRVLLTYCRGVTPPRVCRSKWCLVAADAAAAAVGPLSIERLTVVSVGLVRSAAVAAELAAGSSH